MKLEELKEKLKQHNVPESMCSIDDGLKLEAYVIINNYGIWECFFYTRGEREDYISAGNEEIAYDWLWRHVEEEMKFYNPDRAKKG